VTIDPQTSGASTTSGAGGVMSTTTTVATTGSAGSGGTSSTAISSSASGLPPCDSGPDQDLDHDGFTVAQGDCNDCDPGTNPGAIEIIVTTPPKGDGGIPAPVDEDCDGLIDDIAPPCDTALLLDDPDPLAAARAIELCKISTGPASWGVVKAAWVLADGAPLPTDPAQLANYHLGHGILSDLGPSNLPKAGKSLLALSSGTARRPTDAGYQDVAGFDKGFPSVAPPGFPLGAPSCPGVTSGGPRDAVALDVQLRAPSNVEGFRFNYMLFSRSWPARVCGVFDDHFIVLQSPPPMGAISGNIVYDQYNYPLTLNFLHPEACGCAAPPCFAPPAGPTQKPYECLLGPSSLVGTGFEGSGDTGWLQSSAPLVGSKLDFSLRFAVWDGEDGLFDTTVLVDAFQWIPRHKPNGMGLPPAP
jgi:hypothetical protein